MQTSAPRSKALLAGPLALLATACSTTIDRSFTVEAAPDRVWQVLAEEFGEVDRWASAVDESTAKLPEGARPGELPTGRSCSTSLGAVDENILVFDPLNRVVAFDAHAADMPFFVRELQNQWTLTAAPSGATLVDMNFKARLTPGFNVVMWPLMKGKMAGLLDETIEELTHYLETGHPHPRKVEAMASAEQ